MKFSNTQKAAIALIIANTIWGAGAPIFKWSLTDINPFTLAFLRFFIAAIIIFPFVRKNLKIEAKDTTKVILFAFFGITINIAFYFLGLTQTASINAPIITSSAPIFIIFISFFVLKERPKLRTIIGCLIGLFGVGCIVVQPVIEKGLDASFIGNLLLVCSTFGYIMHLILNKELCRKYSPSVLTFYAFAIGAYTFLPSFLYESINYGFADIDTKGFVGIIWGAFFASTAAYLLFHWAVKYLSASEAGLFTYVDPIMAVIIAIPLLGEIPTSTYLIGAFLVFFGIFIAEGRIHFHPIHKLKKEPT